MPTLAQTDWMMFALTLGLAALGMLIPAVLMAGAVKSELRHIRESLDNAVGKLETLNSKDAERAKDIAVIQKGQDTQDSDIKGLKDAVYGSGDWTQHRVGGKRGS